MTTKHKKWSSSVVRCTLDSQGGEGGSAHFSDFRFSLILSFRRTDPLPNANIVIDKTANNSTRFKYQNTHKC